MTEEGLQFTKFQLGQITRFAATSEALHRGTIFISVPGMAKAMLGIAMKNDTLPEVLSETLSSTIKMFEGLCAYSEKSKRVSNATFFLLSLFMGYSIYLWYGHGIKVALPVLIASTAAIFIGTVVYGNVVLRSMAKRFHLTN